MRFYVHVTVPSERAASAVRLEAESWQQALEKARLQRGESSAIVGFPVELREACWHVTDPSTGVEYDVREDLGDGNDAAPGASSPVGETSMPGAPPPAYPAPAAAAPSLGKNVDAGRTLPPPPPMIDLTAGPPPSPPVSAPVASASARPLGSPRAAMSTIMTELRVLSQRSSNATENLPLTYRECVYALGGPTSENDAAAILQAQLQSFISEMQEMPAGKFVQLAAYEEEFQGVPPNVPLVTLSWKDWRGQPEITYPRRAKPEGAPKSTAPKPLFAISSPPPAMPARVETQVPVAATVPSVQSEPLGPSLETSVAAPSPGPRDGGPSSPSPQNSPRAPMVGAAPSPAVPAPPAAVFPFAATDPFTGGHAAFPEAVPTEVVPNPVVTAAPVAAPSHGSLPEVARSPMLSKHDEFLSHLFETIHDLHFLRDALEGGEFCLSLAKDALGMEAGFVSFHNFAKREFVVACAKGERATSHLMSSVPENDGVLRQALRERRCLALNGLPDTDAGSPVRYREFSAVRSILVAPILQGMRVLGAIELVNSSHGGVFSETDSHALAYIAEQFSLYLSSRGVIVDPAKIAKASNLASAP